MMEQKTSRYTSMAWLKAAISIVATCLVFSPIEAYAQDVTTPIVKNDQPTDSTLINAELADSLADLQAEENRQSSAITPTKYIPTEKDMKQTFFQGVSVSADVLNMGLYFLSSSGNLEAAIRINLLNTYFPTAELGLGRCNKTDYNTKIHFSTNAPFLRVGMDYNVLKDKWQTNKLFVGLRYGITNFNYSFDGPPQTDPIWHETQDFAMSSLNATSHFAEFVFGCQVKIWSFVHMGWQVRYKKELHTSKSLYSHPYYIPGYGTTTNGSCWAVSYNLCFDLNWGKKKPNIKEAIQNAINTDAPKED